MLLLQGEFFLQLADFVFQFCNAFHQLLLLLWVLVLLGSGWDGNSGALLCQRNGFFDSFK
jgi:hypothetical protein